jgi:hypothetical protein
MQVEESTPTTSLRPTRAGFVRGLPLTMPIAEVIERGREAGIELQPSDIHAARYYMRQVAAKESSDIPQQLLLGGTFVTKRPPGGRGQKAANGTAANGANGSASADGAAKIVSSAAGSHSESAKALSFDGFDQPDLPERPDHAASSAETTDERVRTMPTRRGRKPAHVEVAASEPQTSLHTRLQSRLRQATFRDTAREAAEARAERDERATIGKALDVPAKGRGKRVAKSLESHPGHPGHQHQEEELRLIALRIGTQRARELLDEMEALAARA